MDKFLAIKACAEMIAHGASDEDRDCIWSYADQLWDLIPKLGER